MGRAQLKPSRRLSVTGTDPHLRSLRPRSGTQSLRSQPPTAAPRSASGLASLVATLLAAAMVTSALVFLVWVKMSQVQIGYDLHRLQQDLVQLRREKSALEVEVSSLRRPERLARIGEERFQLLPPSAAQVIRWRDLRAPKKAPTP